MKTLLSLGLACLLLVSSARAHQPVIVGKDLITTEKPEISRAFYDELNGKPQIYRLISDKGFDLYVNLLVPKNTNADGRYSAVIYRTTGGQRSLLKEVDGSAVDWREFYEPFGGDTYLKGPEWKQTVAAGTYEIEVFSDNNLGKYVLAVGEKEHFGPREILNVYTEVPKLKEHFFGENPFTFLLTPFGIALLAVVGLTVYLLIGR